VIRALFTVLTLAACGGGTVQYATTKYPPTADRLARVEKGAIATGCDKLSAGARNVSFGCGKKILLISDYGNEGLDVMCDGYSKEECGVMLDKFVAAGN
jgi:hypothetical protein